MKNYGIKLIAAALSGLLILPLPAYAAAGDTDGDGKITASDAREVLRVSVGLSALTAAGARRADADNDGVITASDARQILRAGVGLQNIADRYYIDRTVSEDTNGSRICVYAEGGRLQSEEFISSGNEIMYKNIYRYSEDGILMSIRSLDGLNTFSIKENPDGSIVSSGRIPGVCRIDRIYSPAPSCRLLTEKRYSEKMAVIKITEYDEFGRVSSVTDGAGTSVFTYKGSSDRLLSEVYPDGKIIKYSYRNDGRVKNYSVYSGGSLIRRFDFVRSADNRETARAAGPDEEELYMTVEYDCSGAENISKITFVRREAAGDVEFYPVDNYFYEKF